MDSYFWKSEGSGIGAMMADVAAFCSLVGRGASGAAREITGLIIILVFWSLVGRAENI